MIKTVKIESGITSIGDYAFEYCYSLESITIGNNVISIAPEAFSGTAYYRNESNWENDVLYIGKHLIKAKATISGTYEIKKDTKTAVVEAGYFDGVGVTGPKDSVRLIDKIRAIKRDLIALSKDGTRYVEINEKRYPILGRIGMKNFMIDISNENVQIGEKIKIDINLVLANQNIKRELR